MKFGTWKASIGLLSALLALGIPVFAKGGGIDAEVDQLIRKSCSTLAQAQSMSLRADISFDELSEEGEMIAYRGQLDTSIKRPDSIRTTYRDGKGDMDFWFDGDQVTLMDPGTNLYASEKAPRDIDAVLAFINERLGFSLPLGDFYYDDPYAGLLSNVTEGSYVGKESIGGIPCHRLALVQEDIDWDIWIEDSDQPVPRKLTITYKNLPGKPRYTTVISDWNFSPDLSKRFFIFDPPLGAERIGFLPAEADASPEGETAK